MRKKENRMDRCGWIKGTESEEIKMRIEEFLADESEKPLDRMPPDGGFCGILRSIACIGDSLSSGELEAVDEAGNRTYHDMFEHSWGQYLARLAGCRVLNFSRGGMTAKEYMESFAEANGFFDPDRACAAYILALGVNDLYHRVPCFGSLDDVRADWRENGKSFAGYYAAIVARYREICPDARFFFMTLPREGLSHEKEELADRHAAFLYALSAQTPHSYVIDFRRYGPDYDETFRKNFFLSGHLSPAGYLLTARMTAAYIDYIIRHNMRDFKQVGFIGTPWKNCEDGRIGSDRAGKC